MGTDPSTLKAEPVRRVDQRLREHSRQLVRAAQRVGQVRKVVSHSAATAYERRAAENVVLPTRETVEALRAEIARLRVDNEDLRASARLWADLYEAQVMRANGGQSKDLTALMPDNLVKTNPPPACPSCDAVGTAKQETTIKGASTTTLWQCTRCGHGWTVTANDAT